MIKSMWLFRSNLRPLEYYHQFKSLEEFNEDCHDFYLMQGMWYLENGYLDEFVVWRLAPKNIQYKHVLSYELPNGSKFKQLFVNSFNDIFTKHNEVTPMITLFRGGFPEYDQILSSNKNAFGTTLYLAAGKRTTPQYGGVYDRILVESNEHLQSIKNSIPFYKTCNPNVFFQTMKMENVYDIIFPSNFTQRTYKGQEFFIKQMSKSSDLLQHLNIVHIGNKPEIGKEICRRYGITNLKFGGYKNRNIINTMLNKSKFGIICSNKTDGCPRVITEIMASGTPLLIREETKLLDYYKSMSSVLVFNKSNMMDVIDEAINDYEYYKEEAIKNLQKISMDKICDMNWKEWTKKTA